MCIVLAEEMSDQELITNYRWHSAWAADDSWHKLRMDDIIREATARGILDQVKSTEVSD